MKKDAKLGISVALFSMLCYFLGYYSMTACAVLFAVALAFAENKDLKINATQAMMFTAVTEIVSLALSTISTKFYDVLWYIAGFFQNAFEVHNVFVNVISWMSKFDILAFASNLIHLFAFIMMIVFVIGAMKGGVVKVPFVSKTVAKHFEDAE